MLNTQTLQDEFPYNQVVKNMKKQEKKASSSENPILLDKRNGKVKSVKSEAPKKPLTIEKKDGKKVVVKTAKNDGPKKKKIDIMKKVAEKEKSEGEAWSDPKFKKANAALGMTLNTIVAKLKNSDEGTSIPKRVPKLAATQTFPYVGNSTVKRVIDGVTSTTIYDPFELVADDKLQNLHDFLKLDGYVPNTSYN